MHTAAGRHRLHQEQFSANRPSGAARVATGHDGRTTDSRRPQRHRAQSIPDVNYYGDGGDAYGAEGSDGGAYDTSTSAGYSDFGFDEADAAAAAGNGKPGQ